MKVKVAGTAVAIGLVLLMAGMMGWIDPMKFGELPQLPAKATGAAPAGEEKCESPDELHVVSLHATLAPVGYMGVRWFINGSNSGFRNLEGSKWSADGSAKCGTLITMNVKRGSRNGLAECWLKVDGKVKMHHPQEKSDCNLRYTVR